RGRAVLRAAHPDEREHSPHGDQASADMLPPVGSEGEAGGSRPGLPVLRRAYWTFAVSELAAFRVKVQLAVLTPPLLHTPDQNTDRVLVALRVMLVPTAKLAERVVPTGTLSPAGVERTLSPARPVAVTVSVAVVGAAPQTFATPPPAQVCGAGRAPQVRVPPQPSAIGPQFFPCAAQVVGVHTGGVTAGFTISTATWMTPPPVATTGTDGDAVNVVTVKVALVAPAGTMTLAGEVAAVVLSGPSLTSRPSAGAGPLRVTIPVEDAGPTTVRMEVPGPTPFGGFNSRVAGTTGGVTASRDDQPLA